MAEVGEMAPEFTLPDQDERPVSLKAFRGRWVVLYFYPRDNTSGCTKEAEDFTALRPDFEAEGAVILGVSPDSPASHRRFIEKHALKLTLLSDAEKHVLRAYGAWGVKKRYGKESEGVIRSTFLIRPDGVIAYRWRNVRVRVKRKNGEVVRHAQRVLEKLREMK